jgi:hypothetical protein
MASHHFLTRIGRIVLGCTILGLGSRWSTAQETVPLSPQSATAPAAGDSGGGWQATGRIVDGKLSGQIYGLDREATGQASPINVSFVQNGKVVATATSDGFGAFQVADLPPGTYSMLVYGPGGVSAVSVQVLPASAQVFPAADGNASDPTTTLTADVVPPTDSDALNTAMGTDSGAPSVVAAAGTIPADTPPQAPGGGGGGGDAGAAALGAAAAAAGIGAGSATGSGGGAAGGAGGAAASAVSNTQ